MKIKSKENKFKRFTISLPGNLLARVQIELAGENKSKLIGRLLESELERRQEDDSGDLASWFRNFHKTANLKKSKLSATEEIRLSREARTKQLLGNDTQSC